MGCGSTAVVSDQDWLLSIDLREDALQVSDPRLLVEHDVWLCRIVDHVGLVMSFGLVKWLVRLDGGCDLCVEALLCPELPEVICGDRLLFLGLRKYDRSVLRTRAGALPIDLCRIVRDRGQASLTWTAQLPLPLQK
jgi:hypothetical protein